MGGVWELLWWCRLWGVTLLSCPCCVCQAMATSGYNLPPGRGYHFSDGACVPYTTHVVPPAAHACCAESTRGHSCACEPRAGPFVEYIGTVPAAERPALMERLQAEVDRLVAASVPTVVKSGTPGSSVMTELGVRPEFLSGYEPDQVCTRVAPCCTQRGTLRT